MKYKIFLISFLIVTIYSSFIKAQQIVINELMPSNSRFADEDDDYPDWFEL